MNSCCAQAQLQTTFKLFKTFRNDSRSCEPVISTCTSTNTHPYMPLWFWDYTHTHTQVGNYWYSLQIRDVNRRHVYPVLIQTQWLCLCLSSDQCRSEGLLMWTGMEAKLKQHTPEPKIPMKGKRWMVVGCNRIKGWIKNRETCSFSLWFR